MYIKEKQCNECPLVQAVFVPSEVNTSRILFLAEAPGLTEAQQGKPLVGVAGQDLADIMLECGLKRLDGSYMNAVTCLTNPNLPVFTSRGWIQIKRVGVGELVLTHNGRFKRVLNKVQFDKVRGTYYTIYTDAGRVIVSSDHRFNTEHGWRFANTLLVGEKIQTLAKKCPICGKHFYSYNKQFCSKQCSNKGTNGISLEVREKSGYIFDYLPILKVEKTRAIRNLYSLDIEDDESFIAKHFVHHNCRPTKVVDGKVYNRTPTHQEIELCNARLVAEIDQLQPAVIVCMGKTPYVALGGDATVKMADIVGLKLTWRNKHTVIITYHPAAISHAGGRNTERGREIRGEIKKAIQAALKINPEKQLTLLPVEKSKETTILDGLQRFSMLCNRWWKSTAKCTGCHQKFYCNGDYGKD